MAGGLFLRAAFRFEGAEGFAELVGEEDGGEGHGEGIGDGLGQVDAQGRIRDEVRQQVDQRDEQDEFAHDGHDDGADGLADGDEGDLAGLLDAEDRQHRAVDAKGAAGEFDQFGVRREDPGEHARAKHDKRPDQRGIRQADGQEHAEGLSDALDVFRAVVIAQDRLRALRDPLQGQERKLHDAREDGHGADGDIAAVAGQRGIEADGEHALARLHDKRRRAEAHAGQDEPRALQEVLHAQLQDAFFAEQEQHDPQARHAL